MTVSVYKLPPVLTSYDFLKTAAVLLMIVDHVGHFFFPEEMWFRVAGRLAAPIWLFLIGYARSRDLSWRIWAGLAALTVTDLIVGQPVLPLSILATMILARLILDPVMRQVRAHPSALFALATLFLLLTIPSVSGFEYGSAAMLPVMLGYLCRHRGDLPVEGREILLFAILTGAGHAFVATVLFFPAMDRLQVLFVWGSLVALMVALLRFAPATYPGLTGRLPGWGAGLIRLGGRRTLEIYVIHLILLRLMDVF